MTTTASSPLACLEKYEGPLWLSLISLITGFSFLPMDLAGSWLVVGVGLITLLRMKSRGMLWVVLGAVVVATHHHFDNGVFSIKTVIAGIVFAVSIVFQSWFAWRAVIWLENRQATHLMSRSADVFPFALLACLLPALLGGASLVLIDGIFSGSWLWVLDASSESWAMVSMIMAKHAIGLLLVGPLYWAAPQLKKVSKPGLIFGWLFFALPVLLNEEIYFGLAILAYPAAIIVARWLRFSGIVLAVSIATVLSLVYINWNVAGFEDYIVAEWLLDAVLFSATLGVVALYSAIAFEELEARGEHLEMLVAKRTADLEQANRRLTEIASIDALTGIANRRQWNSRAELAVAQASLTAEPLSVMIIDIDHFKQVNDRYGHDGGDAVLKQFATRCSDVLRTCDTFARLGGEEFALMLQGMDLNEAHAAARKLHELVKSEPFVTADETIRVTVSIGVAEWRHNEESLRAVMTRADEALYKAKQCGRDRVELEPNLKVI